MTAGPARAAETGDAAAISTIYNQGIEDRTATFETRDHSAAEIAEVLEQRRRGGHPVVVVGSPGAVVAFAWASAYSARDCYRGVAEYSVYVHRDHRGQGLGAASVAALISACEQQGFWKLTSRIFPENRASLSMCARLGFRVVGTCRRHGRLDGRWRDCVEVELLIGEALEP